MLHQHVVNPGLVERIKQPCGQQAEAIESPTFIHREAPVCALGRFPVACHPRQLLRYHVEHLFPRRGRIAARTQPGDDRPDLINDSALAALRHARREGRKQPLSQEGVFGLPKRVRAGRHNPLRRWGRLPVALATTGRPRHQVSGDLGEFGRQRTTVYLPHKLPNRTVSHLEQGHGNAAQRGPLHGALRPVVKADDRDILRHPQPCLAKRLHRAQGRFVVARKHCGKLDAARRNPSHRIVPARVGMPPVRAQPLIGRQPQLSHRDPVCLKTLARVATQIFRASGNKGHRIAPVSGQMPHRLADPRRVVRGDGRTTLTGAHEGHGVPGSDQRLDLLRTGFRVEGIHYDEAVRIPRAHRHEVRVGRELEPRRAHRVLGRRRRAHAAGQQEVKDRVQVAERRRRPVVLPAGQDADRTASGCGHSHLPG